MEALAKSFESEEGVGWEAAGAHLAVGFLVVSWQAVTLEPTHQKVDTGATILANPWCAAAQTGIHFTVLSCDRM